MRWLLLMMTGVAFVLCCTRHSGGALGWWLFVSIVGVFATALAFAQEKISGNSRSETLSDYELKRLREGKPPIGRH